MITTQVSHDPWLWSDLTLTYSPDVPSYPRTVLDGAPSYVNTAAWHCYANPLDWTVLTQLHNDYPSAAQYMTECWTSPQVTAWNWASNVTMGPLQNWASGSIAWTLGSNTSYGPHLANSDACSTCRGLVVVDTSADTYSFTLDYYLMAQYSRFMPRGATIASTTKTYTWPDGTGIQSVASVNPDGTRTVVIENKFGNAVYVTVNMNSGDSWSGNVYQNSVVTWVLPPN
jgi:glucan endo-1,6-beta-glucosidase